MIGRKRRSSDDHTGAKRELLKKQKSISTAFRECELSDDEIGCDKVDGCYSQSHHQDDSVKNKEEGILTTLKHGFQHFTKAVVPCIPDGFEEEEEPMSAESVIKLPHPDGYLQSMGVKFSSNVETGDKSMHTITEVQNELFKEKLRPGDIIHKINGLNVDTRRHRDILDLLFHCDEEVELIVKRKTENTLPPDEDLDEEDWAAEIVTHIRIHIKLSVEGDRIVCKVVSCVELEFIDKSDDDLPMIKLDREDKAYIYKPTDSGTVLAMTDNRTLGLIANKTGDLKGCWTVYYYNIIWTESSLNEVSDQENPSIAIVFYNEGFQRCLTVAGKRLSFKKIGLFNKPLKYLRHVDGRVFYKREWSKGTNRVAFESALYRGFFLFRSGGGIILSEQDPANLPYETGFDIYTEKRIMASLTSNSI